MDALAGPAVSRSFAAAASLRVVRVPAPGAGRHLPVSADPARLQQCGELREVAANVAGDAVVGGEAPVRRARPQRIFLDVDDLQLSGSFVSCGCQGPCAPTTSMQSASFRCASMGSVAYSGCARGKFTYRGIQYSNTGEPTCSAIATSAARSLVCALHVPSRSAASGCASAGRPPPAGCRSARPAAMPWPCCRAVPPPRPSGCRTARSAASGRAARFRQSTSARRTSAARSPPVFTSFAHFVTVSPLRTGPARSTSSVGHSGPGSRPGTAPWVSVSVRR